MPQKIKLILIALLLSGFTYADTGVLEEYPGLKKFLDQPPKSRFRVGAGIHPISVVGSKFFAGGTLFAINLEHSILDWDLFHLTMGRTFPKESLGTSIHFAASTIPRVQFFNFLSFGVLLGVEYVSFPKVLSKISQGGFETPVPEPFSAHDFIYGLVLSQTFRYASGSILKINEIVYKQTYSPTDAGDGWTHRFEDAVLESDEDKTVIKPNFAFMIEIVYMF